jgi:hypothetical protein
LEKKLAVFASTSSSSQIVPVAVGVAVSGYSAVMVRPSRAPLAASST